MKNSRRIVTVTMNPAVDLTCTVPGFIKGEVNRVAEHRFDPAGKGVNIGRLLRMFDLPVSVTGFLGADNSVIFEQMFQSQGLRDEFIRVSGETRLGVKVLDPDGRSTTDINFPGLSPTPEQQQELMNLVGRLAVDAFAVVLGGSLPRGVAPEFMANLVSVVREQGARAVVDTSGPALNRAIDEGPWLIKPNDEELAEYTGRSVQKDDSLQSLVAEARRLNRSGVHTVVVSLGARGAVFVESDQAVLSRPPKVDVVSTVGAGDAMVGGLVAGMVLDMSLNERARLATALSAAVVKQVMPGLAGMATAESLRPHVEIEKINA